MLNLQNIATILHDAHTIRNENKLTLHQKQNINQRTRKANILHPKFIFTNRFWH